MIPLPTRHANLIQDAIKRAQEAGDLPAFDVPELKVERPKNPDQGDYACPVMPLAKLARSKPLDIANAIVQHLSDADFVGSVEVARPGFINFRLSESWLREQVNTIIKADEAFGRAEIGKGKRAQVEFLSANPTGPITIGRTRGAILGEGISRVLEAAGYTVTREYYFNNAGAQMRNLGESLRIRYLEHLGRPVERPQDFYQGEYLIEFARDLYEEQGEALADEDWQPFKDYAEKRIFGWIKDTLKRVNIEHDVFFNENTLYENGALDDVLQKLKDGDYVYVSPVREGEDEDVKQQKKDLAPATWFRTTQLGDDEDRVLVKSNGEPTYTLPDIAYHVDKIERGFDLLVNVLGSDHKKQAEVVRMGLQALSYDTDLLHVVFMQMMRMVRDGQEVKMSTRRAEYVTLDEMIDMTSADAVQYFLLGRSPDSQLTFDVDLAVKQSNENPVYYIQYAHVRCAGIFREAEARGVSDADADLSLLDDEALAFVQKALELTDIVEFAARGLTPHTVAHYALDLANQFHPMYDRVRVFGEGVPPELARARLRFYRAAKVVFRRVLELMGMSTPEHM